MTVEITTSVGEEMLHSVTPIYNNDDQALAIFEANGKVMDEIAVVIEGLKTEMYPQNASWTLPYWEQMLKIKHKKKMTTAERVQVVLFELNKYFTVTRNHLERAINIYVPNKDAEVTEDKGEYSFTVDIPSRNHIMTSEIHSTIEELKPAHLDYLLVSIERQIISLGVRQYDFPVPYPICNTFHTADIPGILADLIARVNAQSYAFDADYPICGTFVTSSIISQNAHINVTLAAEYRANDILYKRAGTIYAGEGEI